MGALILLAGCSSNDEAPDLIRATTATATVERGDIVSVLTLPAVVVASASFQVTAPAEGAVTEFNERTIIFVSPDGSRHEMQAPEGGTFVRALVSLNLRVQPHYPIAEARLEGFALRAAVEGPAIYRLYSQPISARGQIKGGPGPFDCPLLSRVPTSGDLAGTPDVTMTEGATEGGSGSFVAEGPAGGTLTISCAVPSDVEVFAGMPAIIALTTAEVHDVLVLPVEAVAGSADQGEVLLETPKGVEVREVDLGPTDGLRIQIVGGLAEGDVVRIPGPDLAGMSDEGG
jgi:hypothetical protein